MAITRHGAFVILIGVGEYKFHTELNRTELANIEDGADVLVEGPRVTFV